MPSRHDDTCAEVSDKIGRMQAFERAIHSPGCDPDEAQPSAIAASSACGRWQIQQACSSILASPRRTGFAKSYEGDEGDEAVLSLAVVVTSHHSFGVWLLRSTAFLLRLVVASAIPHPGTWNNWRWMRLEGATHRHPKLLWAVVRTRVCNGPHQK